jgi:hypothetical protein
MVYLSNAVALELEIERGMLLGEQTLGRNGLSNQRTQFN